MTGSPVEEGEERRFHPTSGTAIGWVGIGLAVVAVLVVALDDVTVGGVRFALVAVAFGLLVWCFMLRPRLVIRHTEVELRNALSSWHVPLASIRTVSVRAITRITTDDGAYDGIAIGRPMRTLRHLPDRPARVGFPGLGTTLPAPPPAPTERARARQRRTQLDANAIADFAVERVLEAADRVRAVSPESRTPHRRWARLEIAALAVVVVALLVTFVL